MNIKANQGAGERSMYPGDQWKMREMYGGGAKVKFCQTKMETQSCKYGFIC